jgi:hypothetical protein
VKIIDVGLQAPVTFFREIWCSYARDGPEHDWFPFRVK